MDLVEAVDVEIQVYSE